MPWRTSQDLLLHPCGAATAVPTARLDSAETYGVFACGLVALGAMAPTSSSVMVNSVASPRIRMNRLDMEDGSFLDHAELSGRGRSTPGKLAAPPAERRSKRLARPPRPTAGTNHRRFTALRSIQNQAHAAARRDRPADTRATARNPATKDCAIAPRTAAASWGRRPDGGSAAASCSRRARTSARIEGPIGSAETLRSSSELKTPVRSIPKSAIARRPATRETALLTPDAMPTLS